MDAHYGEAITIQGILDVIHISPAHLNRLVKKKPGMSQQNFLMHVRLNAATASLLQENTALKEVAAAIGFGDEYHLSRAFKKRFGVAPQTQR